MIDYFGRFLAARGLDADSFQKQFEYDSAPIDGTDEACRLLHDFTKDAQIAIMSDFDVDGFMSGIICYAGLHLLGYTRMFIMPREIERGYEFTEQDVQLAAGSNLLITADVGISCNKAVAYAKQLGMSVIVTDHHVPGLQPSPADACVNHMLDPGYQKRNCAVCGAFTIWQTLDRYLDLYKSDYDEQHWRDIKGDMLLLRHFAAVATLSDSMPLVGQNHVIVADMLRFFNYINPLSGSGLIVSGVCRDGVIQNVFNNFHTYVLQFQDSYYTGFTQRFLEFSLIPAMNSVRRMFARTEFVYNLFFGTDGQAQDCAETLAELNEERKALVSSYMASLMAVYDGGQVLMTSAHAGILGLMAARVMEEIGLPCVILNDTPGFDRELGEMCYYGSARSFSWYPLLSSVNASGYAVCAGHESACGIKVPVKYLHALDEFLAQDCDTLMPVGPLDIATPENIKDRYDVVMDFEENMQDFVYDVELFMREVKRNGPFGSGLPEPKVLLKFHRRNGALKLLKEGKHVKISLVSPGEGSPRGMPSFQILMWNTSVDDLFAACDDDGYIYVTGYLQTSYFMGTQYVDFVARPALDMRLVKNPVIV